VNGTCGVIWAYAPLTTADVQMSCVGGQLMFVTP
jgi:hypothetical protein